MRFIVDFYRYVILAGIGLMIVGVIYGALLLATQQSSISNVSGPALVLGILGIGLVVMSLGITATFISVHDRHAEIVDELRALRGELERRA
jgi:hypothetical protein